MIKKIFITFILAFCAHAEVAFEYQVKAAFMLNFGKFAEWPNDAFEDPKSPVIFGVLGENPFGDSLEKVTKNKKIGERNIVVKYFSTVSEVKKAGAAHVLFIGTSDQAEMKSLMNLAGKISILSVSDPKISEGNTGVIVFVAEDKKVRFYVDIELAKKFGVKLSSELLKLAKEKP